MSRSGPAALAALALAAGPALLAGDVRALPPPSTNEGLVALGVCFAAVSNLNEVTVAERAARVAEAWCDPDDGACAARALAGARELGSRAEARLDAARHDRLDLLQALEHAAFCRESGDPACLDYVPAMVERKRATMRLSTEALLRESEIRRATK